MLIVSLTIHELAHAKSAEIAGDDTARRAGRISLNPLDHLDPLGTVMMVISSWSGFGLGWAKPVPVNSARLRHPRWDNLKVSLWGPLSNVLIAIIAALVLRFAGSHLGTNDSRIVMMFIEVNLGLALFNMLPICPLDGSHIMSALLPIEQARRYDNFMGRFGQLMLLGLIMVPGSLGAIIGPPFHLLWKVLVG